MEKGMVLEAAYVDGGYVVNAQVVCGCGRHIDTAGTGEKGREDKAALDNYEGIITCPDCGRRGIIRQKLTIEGI
jgi:hypothetical protein